MSNDLLPQARAYYHPSDFPEAVWDALSRNEVAANVILPFVKKVLTTPSPGQLWIALSDDKGNVTYVLSCTTGPLGNYPIFIVACEPAEEGQSLTDAMSALVRRLLEEVPPQRVFSVFSIENVTRAFSKAFETHAPAEHGIRAIEQPYYEAVLAFCTNETLVEPQGLTFRPRDGEDVDIALCLADMSHLNGVKRLCQEFSEEQGPYTLGDAGAELEAKMMIENEQAWVHIVQKTGQEAEIACLVATTRASDNVTAVTKVFTLPGWRSKGCAKRLLHRVCQSIFRTQKDKTIVLYVGTSEGLLPARKTYHKIGFKGLDGLVSEQAVGAVLGKWLEIGFEGTTLGYW